MLIRMLSYSTPEAWSEETYCQSIVKFVIILLHFQPLKPGEKRQWEEWEEPWYRWWALILVVIPVMFYYKPDTK